MALQVALTGGIASGKTTVAALFAERGALLIDSDQLAREVVEPGTPGLAEVVARFGGQVLDDQGRLDRQALGAIVFADDVARADLNAIVHPRVRQRRAELLAEAGDDEVVISVIPLLVETGLADQFDAVVVVDLPEAVQVERLMTRNGFSAEQAQARVEAQAARAERLAAADWVIDNSGAPDELDGQVQAVWRELRNKAAGLT
ncbi:MAG: dephospho-CoA kinase [Brooklawnia sp.]|uniref:dephospho-CoA kinase n=1 Tax=Brooklawnia sp. TaxID=2699740 RepID=UPI003C75D7BD